MNPARGSAVMTTQTPGRDRARLGVVFAALVVVAAVWTAIDRRPPGWDHANHLEHATLCARDLRAGDLAAVFDRSSLYPPLALCLTGAVSMALRISHERR